MKGDDLSRLEALVRDANPVRQPLHLVDSDEAAAVTRSLSRARGMDVPGLLPGLPETRPTEDLLERGRDMDTQDRIQLQDGKGREDTGRPGRWRTAAISFAAVIMLAAVVGLGLVILGDGEGGGELAVTGSGPDITIVDPDGELSAHTATISRLIEETYTQAATLLDVDGVAFSVSPDIPRAVYPDYGVGHSFADADSVVIAIDPWLTGLGDVLPERVPVVVAIALYDVARERGDVSSETLFDSMIWSGLSDHFAEELLGSPLPPWANAFPADRTEELMDRARPLLDTLWADSRNPDLSFSERVAIDNVFWDWFSWEGANPDVPRWAGHTLGYRIIETYQAENPGQTAADLVNTPASVFRPAESTGGG